MQWTLVKIRYLQLKRQLQYAGIFYALLLVAFFAITVAAVFILYRQQDKSPYYADGLALIVLSIHYSRKDSDFVRRQVSFPLSNIFSEYLVFTLPFTLPFLFSPNWFYFPALIIVFFLIACLNIKRKKGRAFATGITGFIPAKDFEWIAGLKKSQFMVLPLLLLAFGFSWLRIAPLALLWLMMTVVISFYQECESLQVLYATGSDARPFLREKIISHSKLVLIIFIPVLVINSIFHPGMIFINLAFLLLQLILLALAIVMKYATYEPGADLRGNSLLLGISSFMILIPFLFLIPMLLAIRKYGRACQNLKSYFHDQH
jgi:hypothetical protein